MKVGQLQGAPQGGRRGRGAFGARRLRKRFLIVCEGAVTETLYFESFPVSTQVEVAVHGEGRNTKSLVKHAEKLTNEAAAQGNPFDEVWVVYDKDDFSEESFNAAEAMIQARMKEGRGPKWRAAWSNPAFELWYLLHFSYVDADLHRWTIQRELLPQKMEAAGLGTYKKNDSSMYKALLSRQNEAIRNAQRLLRGKDDSTPPAAASPCTRVHELVLALNAEIAGGQRG